MPTLTDTPGNAVAPSEMAASGGEKSPLAVCGIAAPWIGEAGAEARNLRGRQGSVVAVTLFYFFLLGGGAILGVPFD